MNLKNINKTFNELKEHKKNMDPCESLPILGIITSHFYIKERKNSEKRGEERLERDYLSRFLSL
jgi:hypothetical protein